MIKGDLIAEYVDAATQMYDIDIRICNKLSVTPYEKRECRGQILFMSPEIEPKKQWRTVIIFKTSEENILKRKYTYILGTRKFLEACRDGYLSVNRENQELVGIFGESVDLDRHVILKFGGIASWELKDSGETVLCYEQGDYFAEKEYLQTDLVSMIRKYTNIEYFGHVIAALKKTTHGALMIVADDAETGADRLAGANRATKTEALELCSNNHEKLIEGMANVDGTILVDWYGRCRAFGVILDGTAKVKGEEKRGSRYNSAINYIGGKKRIAIVVSEDKAKGIEIKYGEHVQLLSDDLG